MVQILLPRLLFLSLSQRIFNPIKIHTAQLLLCWSLGHAQVTKTITAVNRTAYFLQSKGQVELQRPHKYSAIEGSTNCRLLAHLRKLLRSWCQCYSMLAYAGLGQRIVLSCHFHVIPIKIILIDSNFNRSCRVKFVILISF